MNKENMIKEISEILIKIENINLIEYLYKFIKCAVIAWK